MTHDSIHVPVMLQEILAWLQPARGQVIVDGTYGGGGHARALAAAVEPTGRVIAADLDPEVISRAAAIPCGLPIDLAHASYVDLPEVLDELGISRIDAALLDLGLSSDQLHDPSRGFSYQTQGELDLRFDPTQGEPAWRMLARLDERQIAEVIYRFGEERYSRRIARRIVEQRRQAPIRSADQLAALVRSSVPRSRGHSIDPATRTFQALRIAVNQELEALQKALVRLPNRLRCGGRIAVVSFHSLEDRIVKHAFRDNRQLRVLSRRPLRPSAEEIRRNPRARSAKMRVAERDNNGI